MNSKAFDILIVGAGIVGMATAYKISRSNASLKILVIEKESEVAKHQTGRNSGVIHSGLYYKPGSHKAKNCVTGRRELVAFAKENSIPHDVCGKIVVATNENEVEYLSKIYHHGLANEVEGLKEIDAYEINQIEPFCKGIKGLWVPCTGIISFKAVAQKLEALFLQNSSGSRIIKGEEVRKIKRENGIIKVFAGSNVYKTKNIINCAGLYSDKIAEMDEVKSNAKIVGFRGDYYDLTKSGMHKVRNLIYPVPNPEFPFLGVHFTRMIEGGVECGPNAVFVFKREGYNKTDFNLKESIDALSYSGTWKLLLKNWRFGLNEYRRAFSKKLFLKQLQKLVPELKIADIKVGRSGVRAMALSPDGKMIDDFYIERKENAIHVLNAPSPAATSALAIGNAIQKMAEKDFS